MSERLYYLRDFADEVMPCEATLDGWAQWLAQPDPEWSRQHAEPHGAEFTGWTATVTEIKCRQTADGWSYPADADLCTGLTAPIFYLRHGSGRGWWSDNSGDTVLEALDYADDEPVAYVARVDEGPRVVVRLDLSGEKPALHVVEGGHE